MNLSISPMGKLMCSYKLHIKKITLHMVVNLVLFHQLSPHLDKILFLEIYLNDNNQMEVETCLNFQNI